MEQQYNILIVEDDIHIQNMLTELLTQEHYCVKSAFSGTEAVLVLEQGSFDLVLLDLMLPGMSGEEVLIKIREKSDLPVIALSAKDSIRTKVELLRNGANDYITKPFDTEELLVRMEVALRTYAASNGKQVKKLVFKDIELDPSTYCVTVSGSDVTLTKREYLILELLMSNPKKVFTKNNIYESVWNEVFVGEDNAVNVHISNIRQKLAKINPSQNYIQTVWGIGFKMNGQ